MATRKIYLDRYEKVADKLKAESDIEKMYMKEVNICLSAAKYSKDRRVISSNLDHVDFILKDIFGVIVALPKYELEKNLEINYYDKAIDKTADIVKELLEDNCTNKEIEDRCYDEAYEFREKLIERVTEKL